ncbi:hypothetical protein M0805_001746 [Coniferiporia weirii]|nr:hypothetical protein M0805_001746 [Coniferiporia weirii]
MPATLRLGSRKPTTALPYPPPPPKVHFPPTPCTHQTYPTHSVSSYDKAPIVVLPNDCTLPERGCPGQMYNSASDKGTQSSGDVINGSSSGKHLHLHATEESATGYDKEDAKEKLYTYAPIISFKGLETPVVGGSGAGRADVRTDDDVEATEFMIHSSSEDNEEDDASDEEEGKDLTTVPSPLHMCKKSTLMCMIRRGQAGGFPSPDGLILFDKRIQTTEAETIETLATIGFLGERQKQAIDSLSGGWKMNLSCAMLFKANILLLNEQTSYLDIINVV